jgi:hypothetical protein
MVNKISIASTTHATATKEIKSTPMLSIVHLFRFYPYYYLLFISILYNQHGSKHPNIITANDKNASYLTDLIASYSVQEIANTAAIQGSFFPSSSLP